MRSDYHQLLTGTRFGFSCLPPLSVPLDFTVQQRPPWDKTYIKAIARLRDKIASPLSPFPISFRGTFNHCKSYGTLQLLYPTQFR
jgi:hypothetical protein